MSENNCLMCDKPIEEGDEFCSIECELNWFGDPEQKVCDMCGIILDDDNDSNFCSKECEKTWFED